jgi:hypothetical protein
MGAMIVLPRYAADPPRKSCGIPACLLIYWMAGRLIPSYDLASLRSLSHVGMGIEPWVLYNFAAHPEPFDSSARGGLHSGSKGELFDSGR